MPEKRPLVKGSRGTDSGLLVERYRGAAGGTSMAYCFGFESRRTGAAAGPADLELATKRCMGARLLGMGIGATAESAWEDMGLLLPLASVLASRAAADWDRREGVAMRGESVPGAGTILASLESSRRSLEPARLAVGVGARRLAVLACDEAVAAASAESAAGCCVWSARPSLRTGEWGFLWEEDMARC